MKRTLAILLALMMIFSFAACTSKPAETDTTEPTEPAEPGKTVINLYSFTDEVPGMVEKYMENNNLGDKYELNTTIIATTNGAYQPALDQALAAGEVDMYAAEAAFVLKYAQGDAADFAASYEDLGIDLSQLDSAQIAPYTIDIGTRPSDNKLVALAYQATGSAFIYRNDLAVQIWGDEANENPDFVAEKIGAGTNSWDKFFEAAADAKAKGVAIVSGDGDIWHAIENSSSAPWVVDGKLNISPEREKFLDYSKELYDNQYSNRTQDWTEQWYVDMGKALDEEALAKAAEDLAAKEGIEADASFTTKPVLGFYGPAWLINYVMAGNSGKDDETGEMGTYGQWRVCAPNVGFCWGGTWVLAGKDVPADDAKKEFIKGVIEWITLDTSENGLQYAWANGTLNGPGGTKDTVASNVVMDKSDGTLDFLGGQDMFKPFQDANKAANGRVMTQYDEGINDYYRKAVRQYVNGKCTREEAIEKFIQNVTDNLDVEKPAE